MIYRLIIVFSSYFQFPFLVFVSPTFEDLFIFLVDHFQESPSSIQDSHNLHCLLLRGVSYMNLYLELLDTRNAPSIALSH